MTRRHDRQRREIKRLKRKHNKCKTRHHLSPQERYKYGLQTKWAKNSEENILHLWLEKHSAWHLLFANRTLEEIIVVLQRVARAKHRV